MKLKLSNNFLKLTVLFVVVFIIGFMIAQLFTGEVTEKSGANLLEGKPGEAMEKRSIDWFSIGLIVLVIAVIVAFGYYSEKKRKVQD